MNKDEYKENILWEMKAVKTGWTCPMLGLCNRGTDICEEVQYPINKYACKDSVSAPSGW
jgi:hypothetical protein